MTHRSETDRLWARGYDTYTKELKKEERTALAALSEQLKSASDPAQKEQIKERIKATRLAYREKRKAAERSLFDKT